jgi:hypothetical protein
MIEELRAYAQHDTSVCIQSATACAACKFCTTLNRQFVDALRAILGLEPLPHLQKKRNR